jgi:hypothetical protein
MSHFGKFSLIVGLLLGLTGTVLADETETPEMQHHNQQFRDREAKRPPEPFGYRETDSYKKASPEERRRIDEGQRKAQEDNTKIQRWLLQAKLFQDCLDAHSADPYRAYNCNADGTYIRQR